MSALGALRALAGYAGAAELTACVAAVKAPVDDEVEDDEQDGSDELGEERVGDLVRLRASRELIAERHRHVEERGCAVEADRVPDRILVPPRHHARLRHKVVV